MNKYLGLYNTHSEFNNGASLSEPYVAYCKDENHIHYGPQTPFNGHDYVDLGLPSGTLWATCNVGANSPEEYGDYFAWGEIEPKETYTWDNYKWGTESNITKYNSTDGKTVLDLTDDAAHIIMGGDWHMPSATQLVELQDNCTLTWTTQNNISGYLISATNGNSIFLPTAGNWFASLYNAGSLGYYWSYSIYENNSKCARYMSLNSSQVGSSFDNRFFGASVRGVIGQELLG